MLGTRRGQRGESWRQRLLAVGSFKTSIGALTSLGRSEAAGILAAVAAAGMLLLGAGCNTWGWGNRYGDLVRPSPSETSRLLSNAHYYKLMGRPEAALKEMEEAYRADPDNLTIADALAQNYQELGQFKRSQEIYQEVLARHGSNRALQNNLCFSFYLQGDLSKAETCFKEALERDPGNQAARNNLGLLWCRQGKLAEAHRLWEEAEGAAGAQTRMNQALTFLGKAPANYAKLPGPPPQSPAAPPAALKAAATKPALPAPAVNVSMLAAGVTGAAAQAPVKETPPTPPGATAAKAAPPAALKAAATKPALPAPAVIGPKPAAQVTGAAASKVAAAQAPLKEMPPTPPAATAAKAAPPAALKPAAAKPALAAPAVIGSKPAAPVTGAAAGKVAAAQALPQVQGSTSLPKTVPMRSLKQTTKATPPIPPLTALERVTTGIEVRNGNGTWNLAHQTRTLLWQEGFKVSKIGNHIDFGAADTVIYYRPGAERVAQGVKWQVFPQARLEPTAKLTDGVAIKVLLGRDLLDQPLTMARIATAGSETPLPAAQMTRPASQPQAVPSKAPSVPGAPTVSTQSISMEAPIPAKLASPPATALATAKVESRVPADLVPDQGVQTIAELTNTPTGIRHGTRTRNQAHQTRVLLSQEGFNVGSRGNHMDFGAENALVY